MRSGGCGPGCLGTPVRSAVGEARLPGVGANARLRRDFAAPAGCVAAGLWLTWKLPGHWLGEIQPTASCKRTWDSIGGHRRDLRLVVLLLLQRFLPEG